MKKFKFIKYLVFTGILGISPLLAEESGWFVGAEFGTSGVEIEYEYCRDRVLFEDSRCAIDPQEQQFDGYKWGLLGGYKQFFTPKFGLRYYGSFDMGAYSYEARNVSNVEFTNKLNEYTFYFNIDILYNFIANDTWDFGVFGGVGFGGVLYKYTMGGGTRINFGKEGYSQIDTARDFNIKLNLGLRTNIAKRHGIELFAHFGLFDSKKTYAVFAWDGSIQDGLKPHERFDITLTNTPSESLGIRYIFSF